MANFIVQFPLRTEKYQEDILNKRFEIGRKMYNSLVKVIQKRYKEMIKTKKLAGLQRHSKNTEKNEQGKFKRKKRFGKSLANKAPSMHLCY